MAGEQQGELAMTAWLYLVVVILLTRLPLLFHDRTIPRQGVLVASLVQLVAAMLLEPAHYAGVLGLLLFVVNGLWARAEVRFERYIYWIRLGTLLVSVVLCSVFCSRAIGLRFYPEIESIARQLSAYCFFMDNMAEFEWHSVYCVLIGILLCLNEANSAVRLVIEWLDLRPRDGGNSGNVLFHGGPEYKRGRVIGCLERLTLFYLLLAGQFGAVGFVIAAKTMARFKVLDNRDFAEYFLVGTFLSLLSAGVITVFVRALL